MLVVWCVEIEVHVTDDGMTHDFIEGRKEMSHEWLLHVPVSSLAALAD